MPVPEQSLPGRALLRESACVALRDAIVDGTLAAGEQLRDNELGARLNVSRTPIREALARLERTGLVQTKPGCSTVVAPLDARATREAQTVVSAMQLRQANAAFASALDANDADATRANWQTLLDTPRETYYQAG